MKPAGGLLGEVEGHEPERHKMPRRGDQRILVASPPTVSCNTMHHIHRTQPHLQHLRQRPSFCLSGFAFHYKSNQISLKKILKIRKHRKIARNPITQTQSFFNTSMDFIKALFLSIFSLKNISDAPSKRPQVFTSEDFCQDVD